MRVQSKYGKEKVCAPQDNIQFNWVYHEVKANCVYFGNRIMIVIVVLLLCDDWIRNFEWVENNWAAVLISFVYAAEMVYWNSAHQKTWRLLA